MPLVFEKYWIKKPTNPFLNWNRGSPKTPEVSIIWTQLDFQTHFPPKILNWVFPSKSEYEFLYFCWKFCLEIGEIYPCIGILMDQKYQRMLSIAACLDNQTHIFWILLGSFFLHSVNRKPFFEADCSFLCIMEIVLYIGTGVLIDQKWREFC